MLYIRKFYDYFIPSSLRSDILNYSYAKSIVSIGIIASFIIPIFAIFYYYFLNAATTYSILIEGILIWFAVLSLRLFSSIVIAREIIVATLMIFLAGVTIETGGLYSPTNYWLILPGFIALSLGGLRSCLFWSFVALGIILSLYHFNNFNLQLIDHFQSLPLLQVISIIALIIVVLAFAYITEVGRRSGLRFRYRAIYDPLTGLFNRFTLEDHLNQARINKNSLTLLYIDIDNFNSINETLNHTTGDMVLKMAAKRLADIAPNAIIAHMNSDEFVILIANTESIAIEKLLDKLLRTMRKPYKFNNQKILSSVSVGVVSYPKDVSTVHELIHSGELAVASAKHQGGNCYHYFTHKIVDQDIYRLVVQSRLPNAIKKKEFSLYYQPKYSALSPEKIIGVEALLRWEPQGLEFISPEIFVPIAEKMGMISEIGDWVLSTSFEQYMKWQTESLIDDEFTMAVNISTYQLRKPNAYQRICDIIEKHKIPPNKIQFEITESMFMLDKEQTLNIIYALKKMGAHIVLDDFGTGYASLSHLHELPITTVKLDKSFLTDKVDNRYSVMIESVIKLAHELDLKVIAEGVETKNQLEFLAAKKCDGVQGFFLSKPLSTSEITLLMRKLKKLPA